MEKLKNGVTAVIIAYNEEKMISGCLETLNWVDEVLVIDNGSNDNTARIAKKAKARVVCFPDGKTFSERRNKALKETKTKWIFYIDADERVTGKLKNEISEIVTSENSYSVYAVPRRNIILGKEMIHGGWWPDYVERLFLKNDLIKWKGDLHERPEYKGKLGYLKNYLIHNKHETIYEMVEKTNVWSEVEAKLMYDANHPPMNVVRFSSAMAREFWYRMVKKKAFLDGTEGVMFTIYQVFSRFMSYAKLWEMQQINRKEHL